MKTFKSNYFIGICWFVLSLIVSSGNDILVKYLSSNLNFFQVVFFRFLFGAIIMLPIAFFTNANDLKSKRLSLHFIRGLILFLAMSLWCYALAIVPITTATLLTFTIPLFVLMMAPIFLGEKVSTPLWMATIIGFIGSLISLDITNIEFNIGALGLLLASLLFASLDIVNKKFVTKESMSSMLFYSAAFTALLAAVPTYLYWQPLLTFDLILLFVLGIGGNLILYFLLKAFRYVAASAVAPYRYLELIFSAIGGLIVFSELPTHAVMIGACLIIPATLIVAKLQKS